MPPAANIKEELIAKIDKGTPFHVRFLFLYIGLLGVFIPGSIVVAIGSRIAKEPKMLELLAFLRDIED